MTRTVRRWLAGSGALLMLAASVVRHAEAQAGPGKGIVRGVVVRDSSNVPVVGAEVRLDPAGVAARADSSGRFVLAKVPKGTQRLTVRAMGFNAASALLDIPADGLDGLEIGLESAVTTLEKVDVRREAVAPHLREFDGWRRMGLGHFADSTVLWTFGDSGDWAQRFQERVPGLQLKSFGGSRAFASARGVASFKGYMKLDSSDARRGARPACYVRIVVDGVVMYNGFDGEPLFDVAERVGRPVVAAAYFTSAQQPAEFNRLATVSCGTLALWTQR